MDRAEATGFGIALGGHAALLAVLSLGFATVSQPPLVMKPVEVSFVEEVALETAVTEVLLETPAAGIAPDAGPTEDAAPLPVETPVPQPMPIVPAPPPAPQQPAPKPVERPAPPAISPKPRPAASKPAPARPAPAKPAPSRPMAKAAPTKVQTSKGSGSGKAKVATGSRLGTDFLKGIGNDPKPSRAQAPSGAVMSATAMSNITSAIQRQIQPCANRQVNPGPGANRITVGLNLRLNRNGSLASRPTVAGTVGVTPDNARYKERVEDLAVAAFTGCAPLRGLPEELYAVRGGWSNFIFRYKLP